MRQFRVIAALFCLPLCAACPAQEPKLDTFCGRYADAVCARLAECNGSTAEAWCTVVEKNRLCTEVAASERIGNTRYHADYAQSCLDIVAALPCRVLNPGSSGELDVLCSEALNGQVPGGGECTANRECERDFHCDRSATRCPGTCRRLRDADESCDELGGVLCATGLSCIGGVCRIPLAADAGCNDSRECESGLFCDSFLTPAACAPVRSDGPCRKGEADCAARASCNSANVCVASKQAGESCTVGQRECNQLLSCVGGTCQSWGGLGAACGEVAPGEDAQCLSGGCQLRAGQTVGTCVQLDAGVSCDTNAECGRGGQCIGTPRVCVPRCTRA